MYVYVYVLSPYTCASVCVYIYMYIHIRYFAPLLFSTCLCLCLILPGRMLGCFLPDFLEGFWSFRHRGACISCRCLNPMSSLSHCQAQADSCPLPHFPFGHVISKAPSFPIPHPCIWIYFYPMATSSPSSKSFAES